MQERFDFEFFMTFLLPPIIFEAGFNLQVLVAHWLGLGLGLG